MENLDEINIASDQEPMEADRVSVTSEESVEGPFAKYLCPRRGPDRSHCPMTPTPSIRSGLCLWGPNDFDVSIELDIGDDVVINRLVSDESDNEETPLIETPSQRPRPYLKTAKNVLGYLAAMVVIGVVAFFGKDGVYYELTEKTHLIEDTKKNYNLVFALTFVILYGIVFGIAVSIALYVRYVKQQRILEERRRREREDEIARLCRLIRFY